MHSCAFVKPRRVDLGSRGMEPFVGRNAEGRHQRPQESNRMQRKSWAKAECPMARSVDVIGDWGSLMILREAFGGTTRFDDFQKQLSMSRNLLTARLKKLVSCGILQRKPIAEEARRHEYVLTEMGEDLLTTIIALRQWGDRWLYRPSPPPICMQDASDGRELEQLTVRSSPGRKRRRTEIGPRRRASNQADIQPDRDQPR